MFQSSQDGHQKFQDFALRAVCHGFLVEWDRLDFIDQPHALRKLAPYHQHGMIGQRFKMILVHDNSPGVAMSLLDQGSVVKVQVFAI
jgi:hypothetical protein